ncbi:MAG: carboxylesterase family protein [Lachnospiraceae bacterium]|nr:carboxylesterase family protein [Lachnospiraceae bacterium]
MLRIVNTKNGKLQGLVGKDPRITVFRGVPYAKPPVGELRWKAPQPAEDWDGIKKCYEYGDMPMMRIHPGTDDSFYKRELHPTSAEYGMSEDCLYLNIFSPAETVDDNLPVFCYIHGGGLQDGYNYEVEFDGERVARRGVIVVMISYRLGLFGFLAHPEITGETPEGEVISNFGMQDQSLALHWVHENIKNFGGDPNRIVLCGQSAGAGSVQTQLCSNANEGLIAGAICQSSVTMAFGDEEDSFGRYKTLEEAEQFGADFFRMVGINNLAEAKEMDAYELMRRLDSVTPKDVMFGIAFGTCIDGKFVKEPVHMSYYNNRIPNVPMIVGLCMDETKGMFAGEQLTFEEFLKRAEAYGDKKEAFLECAGVTSDEEAAVLSQGDAFNMFLAGSRGFCELRSKMGQNVYYYIFDHDIPGDDAGSFHGSDLWFMFDSLGNSWRPFEGKHYDLARQVCSYWVNFVKTGNPNGLDYNGNNLPEWKPYEKKEKSVMKFYDKATLESLPECPVLDFRLAFGEEKLKEK